MILKTAQYSAFLFAWILLLSCQPSSKKSDKTVTQNPTGAKANSQTNPQAGRGVVDLFIGTYTDSISKGIYRTTFESSTGRFGELQLVAELESPSFLSITPDKKYLVSVSQKKEGEVMLFAIQEDSLQLIDQVGSFGRYPTHIEVNKAQSLVSTANYTGGKLAVSEIDANGFVGEPQMFEHQGSGPNQKRQTSPHLHYSEFFQDKFLYVVDLGIDKVMIYTIDGTKVSEGGPALSLMPGDGPRHLTFHPTKNICFILNELSNTVVSAEVDPYSGLLKVLDRKNTLPEGYDGFSTAADIHVTQNGRFLYASNRGHNSIAIFQVSDDGILTPMGTESTKGDHPRNFTITPDDSHLMVANMNSNQVVSFRINPENGLLTPNENLLEIGKPACLKIL